MAEAIRIHHLADATIDRYTYHAAGASLAEDALEFGPFDAEPDFGAVAASCPDCPPCGAPMIPQEVRAKPSWAEVMHSEQRPPWYEPFARRRRLERPGSSSLQSTS